MGLFSLIGRTLMDLNLLIAGGTGILTWDYLSCSQIWDHPAIPPQKLKRAIDAFLLQEFGLTVVSLVVCNPFYLII